MKLLIVHQAFMSPRDAGGTRHFELGRELVVRGAEVSIVASTVSYLSGSRIDIDNRKPEVYEGVRVFRAFTPAVLHRGFFWRVLSFLTFMASSIWAGLRAGRSDVVMGTSPPIFQALSAWLLSFLWRKPFLFEVRDLWPEFAIDMGVLRNGLLIKLSRMMESALYRGAHRIIINSPGFRPYLISTGVPAEKISLIPNGVDVSMFEDVSGREMFRREWGVEDEFVVVYAGAIGPANDLSVLLDAADRLSSDAIRIVIVGDGKERSRLESDASARGLSNVMFVGSKAKAEMPAILAASDCCIAILRDIPMFRTTYPNKVFDYMAASKPVVLAIDGVIRDVVEAARCGVFSQPGDPDALAAALRSMAKNRPATLEMGRRGHSYVRTHFDRKKQADELHLLLETLCRRSKTRSIDGSENGS